MGFSFHWAILIGFFHKNIKIIFFLKGILTSEPKTTVLFCYIFNCLSTTLNSMEQSGQRCNYLYLWIGSVPRLYLHWSETIDKMCLSPLPGYSTCLTKLLLALKRGFKVLCEMELSWESVMQWKGMSLFVEDNCSFNSIPTV